MKTSTEPSAETPQTLDDSCVGAARKVLLIGRRKQGHVILSIVSVLFGVRVRHHW